MEEQRAHREEKLRKKLLKRLDEVLPTIEFAKACNSHNELSCCICFEEFSIDAKVKETKCNHLFHSSCLQEWIKRKIEKPDCPQCRVEIILLVQEQIVEIRNEGGGREVQYQINENEPAHSSID